VFFSWIDWDFGADYSVVYSRVQSLSLQETSVFASGKLTGLIFLGH